MEDQAFFFVVLLQSLLNDITEQQKKQCVVWCWLNCM